MLHKRHLTSAVVALATVLLVAGPAMAIGKFQPLGQYHVLRAASHGASAAVVTTSAASSPSQTATLCSEVCGSTGAGTYWPDTPPGGVPHTAGSGPAVVNVTSASKTFDWDAAAIGAGAAIIAMLLIGGGLRVATTHRSRSALPGTA